jgi:DNA-binding FadR family transcriptional regulator
VTPRHLIEARLMIETTAAALAATRADDDDLNAITGAQRACSQVNSLLERVRWDLTFHLAIVRAAKIRWWTRCSMRSSPLSSSFSSAV